MPSIKLTFGSEIKRVQVVGEDILTVESLTSISKKLYPQLREIPALSFQYVDEEEEQISVASDEELNEALRIFAREGRSNFRFEVSILKPVAPIAPPQQEVSLFLLSCFYLKYFSAVVFYLWCERNIGFQ